MGCPPNGVNSTSGVAKPPSLPDNIVFFDEFLADEVIQDLQNTIPLHLCPSEVEGFGHTLMEALSCRALVLTLDAAPMNELVLPAHGVLMDPSDSTPMHLATRYFFNECDLEEAIHRVLALPSAQREAMQQSAREFFLTSDKEFKSRFLREVANLLDAA